MAKNLPFPTHSFPILVTLRDGTVRYVVSYGPLSRTFFKLESGELVKASDGRYRYDYDDNDKPVEHRLDIISHEGLY